MKKRKSRYTGSLPDIILNKGKLYTGDLKYYYKAFCKFAKNLQNPSHNYRHTMHVLYLCYLACRYYQEKLPKHLIRSILIAAIFHDWDHPGIPGDDDLNIERAVRAMHNFLHPDDALLAEDIELIMRATEFPHKKIEVEYNMRLPCMIIRDADLSQAMDPAWIQQIVFGLSKEQGIDPTEMLKRQELFHRSLEYQTDWAKETFTPFDIEAKIEESKKLLSILEEA